MLNAENNDTTFEPTDLEEMSELEDATFKKVIKSPSPFKLIFGWIAGFFAFIAVFFSVSLAKGYLDDRKSDVDFGSKIFLSSNQTYHSDNFAKIHKRLNSTKISEKKYSKKVRQNPLSDSKNQHQAEKQEKQEKSIVKKFLNKFVLSELKLKKAEHPQSRQHNHKSSSAKKNVSQTKKRNHINNTDKHTKESAHRF